MSKALTNQKTIAGLLEQMKSEIARCLPKHLTPERLTRIALTELRKVPKLAECDPMSFIAAIMQAAQLGLEPGILGSCYLIPFFNSRLGKHECTFMPGYRGFLDLARRSGQIISLVARAVYSNDDFDYEYGLDEKLYHKPTMENRGELIAVYAVALLKDGGRQFEVMSRAEIDAVRKTSKSKNGSPWDTHFEEMAKKTAVRRLFKWLPCSVEIQKAVSLDEQQEVGIQNIKAAAQEEFNFDFLESDKESKEAEEILNNVINSKKLTKQEDSPIIASINHILSELDSLGSPTKVVTTGLNDDELQSLHDELTQKMNRALDESIQA
jgi:recombination protein RecT